MGEFPAAAIDLAALRTLDTAALDAELARLATIYRVTALAQALGVTPQRIYQRIARHKTRAGIG